MPAFALNCLLLLAAGIFPGFAAAETSIQTYSSLMFSDGHAWIRFNGADDFQGEAYKSLKRLWAETSVDHEDDYRQPWKYFPIEKLAAILGDMPSDYLIINPMFGERAEHGTPDCPGYNGQCIAPLETVTFSRRTPERAALLKWGCDYSLVPVLDLGPVAPDSDLKEWDALALGADQPLPVPEVSRRRPYKETSDAILKGFPYDVRHLDGLWLAFPDGLRLGLDHGPGETGGHDLIIFSPQKTATHPGGGTIDPAPVFPRC